MNKHGVLNSEICKVLADLGHTDMVVIADCGLPIPDGVKKIDLALKLGTPGFIEVVELLVQYWLLLHLQHPLFYFYISLQLFKIHMKIIMLFML